MLMKLKLSLSSKTPAELGHFIDEILKILKAQMNKFIFLVSIFSILSSQNVDLYFSLIDEGELDGVKENLPELLSKYPNDPGVLFLKAVLTDDGRICFETI